MKRVVNNSIPNNLRHIVNENFGSRNSSLYVVYAFPFVSLISLFNSTTNPSNFPENLLLLDINEGIPKLENYQSMQLIKVVPVS